MKISQKLSLLFGGLCTLAVLIAGGLFLQAVYTSGLRDAREKTRSRLSVLGASCQVALEEREGITEEAAKNLLLYMYNRFDKGEALCEVTYGGETLCNDAGYALKALLGEKQERLVVLEGKRVFLVGMETEAGVGIYLMEDMTPVFDNLRGLTVRFICIALITIGGAVLGTALLTGRLLLPLKKLEQSSRRMAQGEYETPIEAESRDEIGQLAESFEAMRRQVRRHIREAEELAEGRRLLLGALTHELKTPLTALIGYSEALLRLKMTESQKQESLAFIHKESLRLEDMTQKMLTLVGEQGGGETELVLWEEASLQSSLTPLLLPVGEKKGTEACFSLNGVRLWADRSLLPSMVLNLFDNAASAGARHGYIGGGENCLWVEDDGPGIPPEQLQRVTEPFFRGDKARSRAQGHAGLGLALVHKFMEAHGGRMEIESTVGKGTRVTLYFPEKGEKEEGHEV